MANENTRGNLAAWLATEILSARFIKAHLPRLVLLSMIHIDSQPEAQSSTKKYRTRTDPGVASGGVEGVALTNTYQIATGTSVSVTASEGVADMMEISVQAVAEVLGLSLEKVRDIMLNGNTSQYESILATFVSDLVFRGMRKLESDALALLSGISTTVGSTGVDNSIAVMLAARYQFRLNQPLRPVSEAKYLLCENQANEVDTEAVATSGGVQGAIWGNGKANYDMANKQDGRFEQNGYLGTFLNYPVHTIDDELKVTANAGADVIGAFGVFAAPGQGDPMAPELDGRPGAFCMFERAPLKVFYASHFEGRSAKIQSNANYGMVELVDKNLVGIVTDA
jgi:hypothetical protein